MKIQIHVTMILIFHLINNLIDSAVICNYQMPISYKMQYIKLLPDCCITTLITEYDFCRFTSVIASGND
jgi:hypothetical protein